MCADQCILRAHLLKQVSVPCRSRTFLKALLRHLLHRGIERREHNPAGLAHGMTVLLPLPAFRLQVVVYMYRAQGQPEALHGMQEYARIHAAAVGQHEAGDRAVRLEEMLQERINGLHGAHNPLAC